MRIIGGRLKGRRFDPPADHWPTRPTTDFAKEGLFNILNNQIDFEEIKALDLFGGTGSHSYELISRGCPSVTYVDQFAPALQFVKITAQKLDILDHLVLIKSDVEKYLLTKPGLFDYIFAGPPYPLPWLDKIPDLVFQNNVLKEGGLFVLEHNPNHDFSTHPRFQNLRTYGKTFFSFFC